VPRTWLAGLFHALGTPASLARRASCVANRHANPLFVSRWLARAVFHGMVRYQGRTQVKQPFLFRAVDVGNELFAMGTAASRPQQLPGARDADAAHARELAHPFYRSARRRARSLFRALWHDDARKGRAARHVPAGKHEWLERRIMGIPFTAEGLVPPQVHHGGEEHAAHAVADAGRRGQVQGEGPDRLARHNLSAWPDLVPVVACGNCPGTGLRARGVLAGSREAVDHTRLLVVAGVPPGVPLVPIRW
jgi:hypothetical protein